MQLRNRRIHNHHHHSDDDENDVEDKGDGVFPPNQQGENVGGNDKDGRIIEGDDDNNENNNKNSVGSSKQHQLKKYPGKRDCRLCVVLAFLLCSGSMVILMVLFRASLMTTTLASPKQPSPPLPLALHLQTRASNISTTTWTATNPYNSHNIHNLAEIMSQNVVSTTTTTSSTTHTTTRTETPTSPDDANEQQQKQQSQPLPAPNHEDLSKIATAHGIPLGILNNATVWQTIREKQDEIDAFDDGQRCRRYGYAKNNNNNNDNNQEQPTYRRRIFYGTILHLEQHVLVEDQNHSDFTTNIPWECMELLAAESYGIFHAMVFIVPTHHVWTGTPLFTTHMSPWQASAVQNALKILFGVQNLVVVPYTPPPPPPPPRAHNQNTTTTTTVMTGEATLDSMREEIIVTWKRQFDMTVDDVAYLTASVDEMFARDYARAVQVCDNMAQFKYALHRCLHHRVKIIGRTQVYETSPECISRTKLYLSPHFMIGACLQGIGNASQHVTPPRVGMRRAPGWTCDNRTLEMAAVAQNDGTAHLGYPLWTATDVQTLCGGRPANLRAPGHQGYTAFKFRNWWFSDAVSSNDHVASKQLRATAMVGQPRSLQPNLLALADNVLYAQPLEEINEDLALTHRCLHDMDENDNAGRQAKTMVQREPGGFASLLPFTPLYLQSPEYRKRAHERAQRLIAQDDQRYATFQKNRQQTAATKPQTGLTQKKEGKDKKLSLVQKEATTKTKKNAKKPKNTVEKKE